MAAETTAGSGRGPTWLDLSGDDGLPGAWVNLDDPSVVDLLAAAGFSWVCVDLQHGTTSLDRVHLFTEAAAAQGCPCVVRVPGHDPADVQQALDAGAAGVIVPTVNSPAEASAVAAACRYPPDGVRSFGPTRRLLRHGPPDPREDNRRVVCAVMIETGIALASVDAILAVPGVDVAFVGPYDLGLSLGHSADDVLSGRVDALERIAAACARAGVVPGVYAADLPAAQTVLQNGYRLVAVATDTGLLLDGGRRAAAAARRGRGESR
ncbi:MAG: HpcH/HpaI aldolase family protein [Actinomycetes bacterium]